MCAAHIFMRSFALMVVAAALAAPPSAASELIELHAVSGLPNLSIGDGQAIAWRRIGVVAKTQFVDLAASVSTRALPAQPGPLTVDSNSRCLLSCDAGPGDLGREVGLTLKIPRWHDNAPVIDVMLRHWTAQDSIANSGEQAAGTSAGIALTQPAGSIDVLLGFSMPVASRGNGGWTSSYAGLAWHVGRGTTLEFVADRSVETGSGWSDRTLTARIAQATPLRGVRFAGWMTRSLDDRSNAVRVGAGIDLSF